MSKPKPPTRKEFDARFPDDDACLEHLMRTRWGDRHICEKCQRDARFHRISTRRAYTCEFCGFQVYPTAGTPFESTRTSLKDWFFVMFLFCTSRNGVSAKEVQRTLGVTYKTAWRMCNLIRKYMGYVDGDWPIGGSGGGAKPVEIDEAYIGGHLSRKEDPNWQANKKIALGMVERGGDVVAVHIVSTHADNVERVIEKHVKKGSRVFTDTAPLYNALETEYRRETVNHSKGEYVRGLVHTNTIEGFWSNVQRGISGTYVHVSHRHFQKYLWEFEYRHNMRHAPHLMLETLLVAFPR